MEYGQIFHVSRIGKYYCKNMKYRINIYIARLIIEHPREMLASLADYVSLYHGCCGNSLGIKVIYPA